MKYITEESVELVKEAFLDKVRGGMKKRRAARQEKRKVKKGQNAMIAKSKAENKADPNAQARKKKKMKQGQVTANSKRMKAAQGARDKKQAGDNWSKAVKKNKSSGGPTLNESIATRKKHKGNKKSKEYSDAQNRINKAYGSPKKHTAAKPIGPPAPKKKSIASRPSKSGSSSAGAKA